MNHKFYKTVTFTFLFCSFFHQELYAQKHLGFRFVNGNTLTILGRAQSVTANSYHRINFTDRQKLPKPVAELASNSAGISLIFETNSKSIQVKWILGKYNDLWNMTPLAINGLDMYGWNGAYWQYVASARPLSDTNQATIVSHLDGKMRTYKIYLPLYAELKQIEIDVDSLAVINGADSTFIPKKKVVIYGSSITQGASASRPGMAYPSIVARHLNIETYNMGFSGSGKMEIEMADVLAKMEADVYILDCVPNPSPQQIHDRAVPFIKRLRELKPTIPIILVESIFRENGHWNNLKGDVVTNQNKEFRLAYEQLIRENFSAIYYMSNAGLIGDDHEATVGGIHHTDLGFTRFAKRIEEELLMVLTKK